MLNKSTNSNECKKNRFFFSFFVCFEFDAPSKKPRFWMHNACLFMFTTKNGQIISVIEFCLCSQNVRTVRPRWQIWLKIKKLRWKCSTKETKLWFIMKSDVRYETRERDSSLMRHFCRCLLRALRLFPSFNIDGNIFAQSNWMFYFGEIKIKLHFFLQKSHWCSKPRSRAARCLWQFY